MTASPTPEEVKEVFEGLMLAAKHPRKKRNLEGLHEICSTRYEAKSSSWSDAEIGRLAEKEGLFTPHSLRQNQSKDYRTLIDAWRKAAEKFSARSPNTPSRSASHWIEIIEDPAVRTLVEALRIENVRLKGEVRLLQKAKQPVTIYTGGAATSPGTVVVEPARSRILPTELKALEASISAEHLRRVGLEIGTRGEIVNEDGAQVFPAGWAHGLRKLIS